MFDDTGRQKIVVETVIASSTVIPASAVAPNPSGGQPLLRGQGEDSPEMSREILLLG